LRPRRVGTVQLHFCSKRVTFQTLSHWNVLASWFRDLKDFANH
jgi:hypothetical protein